MDRNTEIAEKVQRVVRMLAAEDLGGVVVSSQHNFAWLTAGGSNGIDLSREPGAGSLLVTREGKLYLLANAIELPRLLAEELNGVELEPVEFTWEAEKADPSLVAERAGALLPNETRLGSDLPLGSSTKPVEGELARCRYQLTAGELDRLRHLGQDAGKALGTLARTVEPGETERQVAARSAAALSSDGMQAVVNLVAGDERIGQYRHPIPTDRRWEKTLMIVACARRGGLIVSLTRIVCVGLIPDELSRRTIANARVNAALLAATQPGACGAELYDVAARAYAAEGFDGEQHLHHQGGATGYRTREWVAHPASAETVQLNQAFAWNPSITGTKVEETGIAGDEGFEVVTSSPDWPAITVLVNGREYLLPDALVR